MNCTTCSVHFGQVMFGSVTSVSNAGRVARVWW